MSWFDYKLQGISEPHEVDGVCGDTDEEYLHDEEIERLPPKEQIDVAGEEDDEVDLLSFVR
jgi:hypothetical protein